MFSHKLQKNEILALAIGQFDGIHRAHRELFRQLGERGGILVIAKTPSIITPNERRNDYVSHQCFYYDFAQIKDLSGEEFIALLKKDFPSLQKIVVGYDFRFGKNRQCGIEELEKIYDGKVVIVPEYCFDGISVHMSVIKELLLSREIFQANRLLGREYSLLGEVKKGQGLGKKSLYPTINIESKGYFIPSSGVYAGRVGLKNHIFDSVIFIGERLSTDGKFAIEAHLIEQNIEVKENECAEIFFAQFLRENQKFETLELLKSQIKSDIESAKKTLKICKIYPESGSSRRKTDER